MQPKQRGKLRRKPRQTPKLRRKKPRKTLQKPSIYDDLKAERKERKEAIARAEAAEARNQELEGLLQDKKDAKTPEEKSQADDDIKAYAEKHGLDADGLQELTGIIAKRLPMPEGLSPEEVKAFRESQATAARQAEDQAVLTEAPKVKEQLEIHSDAELKAVMDEVMKLSHTEAFHDKEVEYIVWKNREALSKLVSPKKPSFESGGNGPEGQAENIDFSSGKVTPEQAQKAQEFPQSSYEIRSAK